MAYDRKCYELAESFLADQPRWTDDNAKRLAQAIQNCVEEWAEIEFPERGLSDGNE